MKTLIGYTTFQAASDKARVVKGDVRQLMDGTYIVVNGVLTWGANGVVGVR